MNKNIEVITLIYKSVKYLKFIAHQLKSNNCNVPGWNVNIRVVANDASKEILEYLNELDIPYSIYNDKDPNDFYLNRVYRCWNQSGKESKYDNICFVNSDMAFSNEWLTNLLKHHNGVNIPCSRLVESGKIPVATNRHGIAKNFGTYPDSFDHIEFNNFAKDISKDYIKPSGLFMPCIFETKRFIESGMYPEGNVFVVDKTLVSGFPNDRPVYASGDAYLFHNILENNFGMKHVTVFDSIVYHIQEGEMNE